MKSFDYEKYLRNNPLLKEARGVNQQEISAFLSKFKQPSEDSYEVDLFYNDYPSISNSDMRHASQVFIATVRACGGVAKRIGGRDSEQVYIVQGCPMDNLQQAWEYLGDYDRGFSPASLAADDESPSIRSARGTAASWQIEI